MPVIPVHHGVEDRYLYSWNRYRQAVTNGPFAAVNSGIRLRNPTGSNVVAVIEYYIGFKLSTDTAGLMTINRGQAAVDLDTLLGSQPNQREDPRGQQQSTTIISINSVALVALTNATSVWSTSVTAGSNAPYVWSEHFELLLMPGDCLQWAEASAVNLPLKVNFGWRERFLEDSERT
jgi:hypothetical protein